jgi:predicted nucleic acid-binding protein
VLDLLLDRRPFSDTAAILFSKVESGRISGYICATSVTTIHYLSLKARDLKHSKMNIRKLLSLLDVAPVNRSVLEGALESKFQDFEDAVVHESACQSNVDAIITRNIRDFKRSSLPVYSPLELVKMLKAAEDSDSK